MHTTQSPRSPSPAELGRCPIPFNLTAIHVRYLLRLRLGVVSGRRDVTRGGGPLDVNVLTLLEVVVLLAGHDTEGVGAEEVTLSLDEVGGNNSGAVAVEEGESSAMGRDGDTPESRLGSDTTPSGLSLLNSVLEEGSKEERLEVWLVAVGIGDVGKEDRLDDASTAPHGSKTGVVEVPVVDLGSLTHEHEALGVRDDLGSVESLLEVVDELLLVALEWLRGGALDDLGCSNTLLLEGRETAGKDSLANKSYGHTVVEGVNGSPLSGTLLSSSVEDLVDHGLSVSVLEAENVTGNLDEERLEDALLPLGKDLGNLLSGETETTLEDVVGLSDELHVSVLDTVVDHLDVVAGTSLTDPVTAWLAVDLGSSLLEDVLDVGPSLGGSTGHERGSVTGTLLTTRNTRANVEDALGLELLAAADGVGVVRVTTVNDNVTLLHVGDKLVNKVVDSLSSLDEKDHTARLLELGAELLNRVSTNDIGALGLVLEEVVDLGGGTGSSVSSFAALKLCSPVVRADFESFVVHVENQILTLAISNC